MVETTEWVSDTKIAEINAVLPLLREMYMDEAKEQVPDEIDAFVLSKS